MKEKNNVYFWVEDDNLKRLHAKCFKLYDILEKVKLKQQQEILYYQGFGEEIWKWEVQDLY